MLCKKCGGRVFVDRQYTSVDHLETFCTMPCEINSKKGPSGSCLDKLLLSLANDESIKSMGICAHAKIA